MGRLRDLGWAIRDRAGGIALDAKDKAEGALAAAANSTTAPVEPAGDLEATVDELNERLAAIEESVSQLREEIGTGATTTEDTTTPEDSTTTPEVPELPEGVEIPGVGEPESEKPPAP